MIQLDGLNEMRAALRAYELARHRYSIGATPEDAEEVRRTKAIYEAAVRAYEQGNRSFT